MDGFVLVAGFGGVVRCEIGVLPADLLADASLDVDFDGDADFCEIFLKIIHYFTYFFIMNLQHFWMVSHYVTMHAHF